MSKRYLNSLLAATTLLFVNGYAEEAEFIEETPLQSETEIVEETPKSTTAIETPQASFASFTGKIKGKRVRVRLRPDLDSPIVSEANKDDLFVIVGEENEFYSIQPAEDSKAYVFRSFVLDNTVEGNRVNIRLHPDVDAPIIGHLNQGDKVNGHPSDKNAKWLEVNSPDTTRFYIAKEFVDHVGGPAVKKQIDQRRETVEALYETTLALSGAEFDKSFESIDIARITQGLKTIINDYKDFPVYVEKATDALIAVQETYLQKKVTFLEEKAGIASAEIASAAGSPNELGTNAPRVHNLTDKMKVWEPVEEGIFLKWASNHANEADNITEFYTRERASAVPINGILEAYTAPVKNRPGDYILRDKDVPVAYVYSTQVNLEKYVGKRISVMALPRPNNNFAFPAYFVLSTEQ